MAQSTRDDNIATMTMLEKQVQLLLDEQKLLNRRAASLQRKNIKLEELNQLKDEFIAIASHQLRTPATAVKQYLELLLSGYADELKPDQKNFLEKANDSNNRQLRIIDDLLQIARIDSASFKLNISDVDIGQLLNETVEVMRDKVAKKGQTINFKKPSKKICTKGDGERIRMVFENLIENASNYSEPNSEIEIRTKKDSDSISVEVKDHGVGIDSKDYNKLFQKFSRIPNPLSVEVGGTGLGLYWASKMTRLHGGDIRVRSKLQEGSSFTVTLPLIKE